MKKIKIKSSYDDLTVEDFIMIREILTTDSMVDKKFHIISALSDLTFEEVRELPVSVVKVLERELKYLEELPENVPVKDSYEINGKVFYPVKNIPDMVSGRYIDMMYFLENNPDHFLNLHEMLAIIMSHDNEPYDKYPNSVYYDDMLSMGIKDAISISLFFYQTFKNCIKCIPDYLSQKEKKEVGLQKDGDGI